MKMKNILLTIMVVSLTASCAPRTSNKDVGTVVGAATGALVGNTMSKGTGRTLAVLAGSLLGTYIGTSIGNSIDKEDVNYADRASQKVLEFNPIGKSTEWVNPDTRHVGTITPTKTIQTADGTYCREFTQTITIANQTQQAFGEACRAPDGTWRVRQQ